MLKYTLFFALLLVSLDAFSQGANNNQYEVISRVYFGSLPYDATDIMNPPVGINLLPCTGYSDFTVGNTNNGDGNVTALEYFTGVLRNETYQTLTPTRNDAMDVFIQSEQMGESFPIHRGHQLNCVFGKIGIL